MRVYGPKSLEALTTYVYTVSALDDAGNERRVQSVQVRTEGLDQVALAAPQNLSAVADENNFGQGDGQLGSVDAGSLMAAG